ncbi:hypothetical protein [Okeania sp. SIO2B3]|uniref:hypothetical protein n=1 Tax=Okeania sp. SIO2B3 TaxID=2607784 RepID=UPI0013C006A9|nr:hypothetical protein [Okeania sp. SIO2B3]NET41273.1 hypothetical protein [Okeania sp. SIO2B3]
MVEGDGEMGTPRRGMWGMGRPGVEKTVSRKETEIYPLSWSHGYGSETSPSLHRFLLIGVEAMIADIIRLVALPLTFRTSTCNIKSSVKIG